jgi:hypothetical protein
VFTTSTNTRRSI